MPQSQGNVSPRARETPESFFIPALGCVSVPGAQSPPLWNGATGPGGHRSARIKSKTVKIKVVDWVPPASESQLS